jgi:hypothetical protein
MSREDRETFATNFLTRQYHLPQFNYKFTVDPEFSVKIELAYNQISYINSQKKSAEECLIKARAYYRALDEYLENQKITSKAYKEFSPPSGQNLTRQELRQSPLWIMTVLKYLSLRRYISVPPFTNSKKES